MFESQLYLLVIYILALFLYSFAAFGGAVDIERNMQLRLQSYAEENNLDPGLVQAIAFVESKYDPKAVGLAGEKGIFQLHPRYHSDLSERAAVEYLAELKSTCARLKTAWFVCYNYGPKKARHLDAPTRTSYYHKVTEAYLEICKGTNISNKGKICYKSNFKTAGQ